MLGRLRTISLAAALAVGAPGVRAASRSVASDAPGVRADSEEPQRRGFTETTGVSLILVDVEVTDPDGAPMPGLGKQDFRVWLNGREVAVYSVDDLCPATPRTADLHETERAPPPMPGQTGAEDSNPAAAVAPNLPLVILYFDYLLLGSDGRAAAATAARHFVETSLLPGQRAYVVGSVATGILELSPVTSDRSVILAALDRAGSKSGPGDAFAMQLGIRLGDCSDCNCLLKPGKPPPDCCTVCTGISQQEFQQGRLALKSLQQFLRDVARLDGPKALVLFQENAVMDVRALYPMIPAMADERDHLRLMEAAAAEATTARAVIYPAQSGALGGTEGLAVNYAANLASFTGGSYNRSPQGLAALLADAGGGNRCLYRIGIPPMEGMEPGAAQLRVEVRGRSLEPRYRVQYLDEQDRWLRKAAATLRRPSEARDLPLAAALVPAPSGKGRWTLTVQVAVDPRSLTSVTTRAGVEESWEVGALLTRDGVRDPQELLALTRLSGKEGAGSVPVLYEQRFESRKPGRYRLAAFVRDRTANLFGGAEASLDLPSGDRDGLVGPVSFQPARARLVSTLPLLRASETPGEDVARVETGPLPAGDPAAPQNLEMWSWFCPRSGEEAPEGVVRYVARDGHPEARVEPGRWIRDGRCFRSEDLVQATALAPGSWEYRIRWNRPGGSPLESLRTFHLESAPPSQPREAERASPSAP